MISPSSACQILLLGSESGFCFHALKSLRDLRLSVAEVLIAGGTGSAAARPMMRGAIPLSQPGSVADLAAREGISVIRCGSTREDWAFQLAHELGPDVALVACLPERLGARWCEVARYGCFNLHPSLLPTYRGPAPLFWQLRDGVATTGVTVHRVAAEIDAGDVLAQQKLSIDGDDTLGTLNAALATAGVRLFAERLREIVAGQATLEPQDASKATRQPWPQSKDFILDPAWPAARAFRFVRATQLMGIPYRMKFGDTVLIIDRVTDVDPSSTPEKPFQELGGVLTIRFSPGTLRAVGRRGE